MGMSAQLKPEIEKRMMIDKAYELGKDLAELSQSKYDDTELTEVELGNEAYAPYRRSVHNCFQMAAAPAFFSCSQRTQLLRSILQAPPECGGAGLSLAQLQRDQVQACRLRFLVQQHHHHLLACRCCARCSRCMTRMSARTSRTAGASKRHLR